VSGLNLVVARIGAIERLVTGAPSPVAAVGVGGGTSFAAELDLATAHALPAASGSAPEATAHPLATASTAAASESASPLALVSHSQASPATDPSYRPAHVTETNERVWNDCTWASAAMLIDKLTGGAVKVNREALRAASGDRTGGSSLDDVVRGARKLLGLDLRAARAERLTVNGLLDRLASGGGAIVQGSYASLPPNLTRNDPGFAAKGVAASGHAVYVGPLDRATGKVWWDDPLAPAGGSGQWISVQALRKFVWTDRNGRVSAMATPAGAGSATTTATGAGTRPDTAPPSGDAAAISAAAWSAGVDRQLLTAYLDATKAPSDSIAIAAGARDLAAALTRYGPPDLALESLGAARAGSSGAVGGAKFAGDVLRRWKELLNPPASGA
jgi:hypothetical protein